MWYKIAKKIAEEMSRQAAKIQYPDGYLISLENGKVVKLPAGMTHPDYVMANAGNFILPQNADPSIDPDFMEKTLRDNNLMRSRHFFTPYNGNTHHYEFYSQDPRAFQIAQKHYLSKYARDHDGRVSLDVNGNSMTIEPFEDWQTEYNKKIRKPE